MIRPKPDPTTHERADLGDLLVYALDVYRVTRTPDGEIAHLYAPGGMRILRESVSDAEIDNGRGSIPDCRRAALSAALPGVAIDDVELSCGDHEARELRRGHDHLARCVDSDWCRRLHRWPYAKMGRLSADVLALMGAQS